MKRSTKSIAFLDRFVKKYACSSRNHPSGWRWWKRKNSKDVRRRLKKEGAEDVCDNDCEHCDWATCPKAEEGAE